MEGLDLVVLLLQFFRDTGDLSLIMQFIGFETVPRLDKLLPELVYLVFLRVCALLLGFELAASTVQLLSECRDFIVQGTGVDRGPLCKSIEHSVHGMALFRGFMIRGRASGGRHG